MPPPQVRIAACRTLRAFCSTMQASYCDTNSGYLAAGVIIHMDDSNTDVQVRGEGHAPKRWAPQLF